MKNLRFTLLSVVALTLCSQAQEWKQYGQNLYGEAANDGAGDAVAISGDGSVVAFGAEENDGKADRAGHVRVFQDSSGTWIQLGTDIDGEAKFDRSGEEIALNYDGSILVVGARLNDGGDDDAGHVRVFKYNSDSTKWIQMGADIDGLDFGDHFGQSLDIDSVGHRIVVGATEWDGEFTVYDYNGSQWVQHGPVVKGDTWQDEFGYGLSLSNDGKTLAVGAPGEDEVILNSGMVKIYDISDTVFTQIGQNIIGEAEDDKSGRGIDLSANGKRIAIGSAGNDGNGSGAGHVRIFDYNADSTKWIQVGKDIDGEAAYINSGGALALSGDGSRIVIGAPINSDGGYNAGHVRVYDWTDTSWTQVGSDIDGKSFDRAGTTVAISKDGSKIVIGSTGRNDLFSYGGMASVHVLANCATEFAGTDTTISENMDSLISNVADSITKFQWLDCNNSYSPILNDTNKYFIPSTGGNYAVQMTRYGCTDTSVCQSFIIVGFENDLGSSVFSLNPNPTTSVVSISGSEAFQLAEILDSKGQTIISSTANLVDLTAVEAGVYFVRIYGLNGEIKSHLKLIKK